MLENFFAEKGELKIEIETTSVLRAGELALLRSRWSLSDPGRDGRPVGVTHYSAEVVRRQSDGTWLCLIDNPFGGD